MTSTVFVDRQTPIVADWLNDVNTAVYTTLPALSTATTGNINVKSYGAVGDNVADDSAAIVLAAAAARTLGKSLYFPKGNYKYTPTAPLEITAVSGDANGSVIYVDCATYTGVVFRNIGGLWQNITIREKNLIKTSGILYQLSDSTALNTIGGAASFTAYAKSDRVWVFGGAVALDVGNMFTCEFNSCRFNQAGIGFNCTPNSAGGGYANTLNFISCEIADNNKNINVNFTVAAGLGLTFVSGSIERALVSSSTFSNVYGLSFIDVYQEQAVAGFPTITITTCPRAYGKFILNGANCNLSLGTNTTIHLEGWYSGSNCLVGADGTQKVLIINCEFPASGNSAVGSWASFAAIASTYNGTTYTTFP